MDGMDLGVLPPAGRQGREVPTGLAGRRGEVVGGWLGRLEEVGKY